MFENMTSFSLFLSLPLSSKGRRNERKKIERVRKEEGERERGNSERVREIQHDHDMYSATLMTVILNEGAGWLI